MQTNSPAQPLTTSDRRTIANGLLRVDKIYHEPAVVGYSRGRETLARLPNAKRVEVPSHWNISELHGDENSAKDWNNTKKTVLVLGVKKGLQCRPFYRSCDFVAPSHANGCAMVCSDRYVARRPGHAPPL